MNKCLSILSEIYKYNGGDHFIYEVKSDSLVLTYFFSDRSDISEDVKTISEELAASPYVFFHVSISDRIHKFLLLEDDAYLNYLKGEFYE